MEGLAQEAWVEHEGRRYALHPLDPRLNGTTRRPPRQPPAAPSRAFDPSSPDTTPPDDARERAKEAGHD
ncbi:MAG TPA: hypothetical protein VE153_12790 [Myxococcus sp.]|nr:hypothetical protein [Myxococcus sp.]